MSRGNALEERNRRKLGTFSELKSTTDAEDALPGAQGKSLSSSISHEKVMNGNVQRGRKRERGAGASSSRYRRPGQVNGGKVNETDETDETNETNETNKKDASNYSNGTKKTKKRNKTNGDGGGIFEGGKNVSQSVAQLRRCLAATMKKIETLKEGLLRLKADAAEHARIRDRVLEENKLPSIEQAEREVLEQAVGSAEWRSFELSDAERAYTGPPGDRKGMIMHRQQVQARERELKRAKEAYLEGAKKRAMSARREVMAVRAMAERKAIESKRALDTAERQLEMYEKERSSLLEAIASGSCGGTGLHVSRQGDLGRRLGGGACQERRDQRDRQARSGKSRMKRSEILSSPIRDLLLSDLRAFTFQPSWFSVELSERKIMLATISDNLLLMGSKVFRTRIPSSDELEVMLSKISESRHGLSKQLHALYLSLIRLLVEEDVESEVGMARKYWTTVLSRGCWPEIIRRYILLRGLSEDTPEHQRPGRVVSRVAGLLASDDLEALSIDQHLALLHYLSDTAMVDSKVFRNAVLDRQQANEANRKEIKEIAKNASSKALDSRIRDIELNMMEKPDNRTPIGLDRYHRRYWWGLGGTKSDILMEDTHEFIALITSERELDELLQCLDVRERQEHILRKNILLVKDRVVRSIKRKKRAGEVVELMEDDVADGTEPLRQSSRHIRQATFYDPTSATSKAYVKCGAQKDSAGAGASEASERGSRATDEQCMAQLSMITHLRESVLISTAETILILVNLGREAARLGIPCNTSSWGQFEETVRTFGFSYGSEEYKHATAEHILETHRLQLSFLEEILFATSRALRGASGVKRSGTMTGVSLTESCSAAEKMCSDRNTEGTKNSSAEDEENDGSDLGSELQEPGFKEIDILAPPDPKRSPSSSIYLWKTAKERTSWLADISYTSHSSSSRLNYAAQVLHMRARPLLARLSQT